MAEPNQNQILAVFIDQLHRLTEIAGETSCANSINELISNSFEISDILGPNCSYYFDVPSKYVFEFLKNHEKESKMSPDVALALLSETIDNISIYLQGLLAMIRKVPAERFAVVRPNHQERPNQNPINQQIKSSILSDKQEKSQSATGFFRNLFVSKLEDTKSNAPLIQKSGCCTIEKSGLVHEIQEAYGCETCGIKGGAMVCQDCARLCHSGHKLINRGKLRGYCDCRFVTIACKLQAACTFKYSGQKHIAQQKFSCRTCKMDQLQGHMMCQYCADHCHKGHDIVYNGKTESGYCDCRSLYSFCHLNKKF